MTPISFALEILLDCTTIEQAHKKCRKFIKEQENALPGQFANSFPIHGIANHRPSAAPPSAVAQAPSTQRLMAEHGLEPHPQAPVIPTIKIQPATIDKETGRPQVQTGNGTAGPRKW